MKVICLYATLLVFTAASASLGQNVNFTITDFSKNMSLSGSCLLEQGTNSLLMTANTTNPQPLSAAIASACKAVYATPVKIYDPSTGLAVSFNTTFSFAVKPQQDKLIGDSLAFVISSVKAVGTPTAAGLYNDTLYKPVGNPGRTWDLAQFDVSLNDTRSPRTYQAWIDYDAVVKRIDFYIAPQEVANEHSAGYPLFSHGLDLSGTLGYVPAFSYVGFTASTGDVHRAIPTITKWRLKHHVPNPSLLSSKGRTFSRESKNKGLIGVMVGVIQILTVLLFVLLAAKRWRSEKFALLFSNSGGLNPTIVSRRPYPDGRSWAATNLGGIYFGPRRFSYAELSVATNNFSEELGRGGFGSVYKGVILDAWENRNVMVAIKGISQTSRQGEREFQAEVRSIGRLRHRNVLPLLGWCHEQDELLLVYEFMATGSLDQHLYPGYGNPTLSWTSRFQILQGVAAAIDCLHSGWDFKKCILHCDIKPSNMMLDTHMIPRLGDFGPPCLMGNSKGSKPNGLSIHHTTRRARGTLGYIAPEVFMYGRLSKKADVYSFGMVALEVVCGRPPPGFPVEGEDNLVEWVWNMHERGKLRDVIDVFLLVFPEVDSAEVQQQITSVLHLGMLCTLPDPSLRPHTKRLLQTLSGAWHVSLPPFKARRSSPFAMSSPRFFTGDPSSDETDRSLVLIPS